MHAATAQLNMYSKMHVLWLPCTQKTDDVKCSLSARVYARDAIFLLCLQIAC